MEGWRAIPEIRSGGRSAINSSMPRIRILSSSSPRNRKSSRFRSVTARRYTGAQLPLMPGKLSVLLDTNTASLPSGILLKLSIIYRELAVISRHMCTLSSKERIFPSSLSLFLPVATTPALVLLNRCIKHCFSNTIRSYPKVVTFSAVTFFSSFPHLDGRDPPTYIARKSTHRFTNNDQL